MAYITPDEKRNVAIYLQDKVEKFLAGNVDAASLSMAVSCADKVLGYGSGDMANSITEYVRNLPRRIDPLDEALNMGDGTYHP